MTMIEQTADKPKPARKPRRKAHRAAAATPAPKQSVCDGITVTDCPTGCKADCCVISGVGICSHPHKGGLQGLLQNPDSLRRLNEAKRILGKAKIDLQST